MLRTEPTLIDEYVRSGFAKLQFWHILDHGKASVQASAAAECAGQQGAFWQMHDRLFENQSKLFGADQAVLNGYAKDLGLDQVAFEACMQSGEMQTYVKAIDSEIKGRGIRVRPTFDLLLNGEQIQRLQGSPPVDQWRQVLTSLQ